MKEIIIKELFTIIGLIVAPIIGLIYYFKQKEYEIVRQRYLEDCLDVIAANLDNLLTIFRNNWSLSLKNYRLFNTSRNNIDIKYYKNNLIPNDHRLLSVSAFYRLHTLIQDHIFWNATQELVSFVDNTNNYFENDFLLGIELFIKGNIPDDKYEAMKSEYNIKFDEFNKQSYRYYDLLTGIQELIKIFEKEKFSFTKVMKFQTKKEVKDIITIINDKFNNLKNQ